MTDPPDPYATLGVERGASDDEIRGAFRAAMRRIHPDLQADPPADSAAITALVDAWDALSGPDRAEIDAQLAERDAARIAREFATDDLDGLDRFDGPDEIDLDDPIDPMSPEVTRRIKRLFAIGLAVTIVVLVVFTVIAFSQSG